MLPWIGGWQHGPGGHHIQIVDLRGGQLEVLFCYLTASHYALHQSAHSRTSSLSAHGLVLLLQHFYTCAHLVSYVLALARYDNFSL